MVDFLVSKESGIFLASISIILLILFHSWFALIDFEPGLVDSPPTSIKSAPKLNKLIACFTPLFFLLNFPPSEKLSGVIFNTPSIFGFFLKFKLEKFFFFNFIFFKSEIIFDLIFLGKYLISLIEIFFYSFEWLSQYDQMIFLYFDLKVLIFFYLLKFLIVFHNRNYTL